MTTRMVAKFVALSLSFMLVATFAVAGLAEPAPPAESGRAAEPNQADLDVLFGPSQDHSEKFCWSECEYYTTAMFWGHGSSCAAARVDLENQVNAAIAATYCSGGSRAVNAGVFETGRTCVPGNYMVDGYGLYCCSVKVCGIPVY